MTEVKICGVRDAAGLDAVAVAGADWVGFVFFPPSPRAVTPSQVAMLMSRCPDGPRAVGLFVDPSDEDVRVALSEVDLAVLQIHGTAERAAALRAMFGVPVWHAVGVGSRDDLPGAAPGVDRVLLDHKALPGATRPGGNAASFDWSVLQGWAAPKPWLLAGGLTPATVATAIRETGAPGVDVSSGVEQSRGVKDPGLIRAFVEAVREA